MTSSCDIKKGITLTESMVTYKNPGTGIPPKSAHMLIGKCAKRDILTDELLDYNMFDIRKEVDS